MKKLKKDLKGQSIVAISVLLLVFLVSSAGLIAYLTSNSRAITKIKDMKTASYIAEAGIAKAVFCLNHDIDADCGGTAGSNYPGESNVSFGDGTFTTTVVNSGADKVITAQGVTDLATEKILRVNAYASPETTDVSFVFGAQVGDGGVNMSNNSLVIGAGGTFGNIYSNGSINCGAQAAISGSVKVAGGGNKIDGCDIGYDGAGNLINDLADAWAHILQNCQVAHDIYHDSSGSISGCPYGLGAQGGTVHDQADLPPALSLSITDQMIQDWKTDAAAGNGGTPIVGPYTPTSGATIGPVKIEGDLNIALGTIIYIGGVIWVEGNINIGNDAEVRLLPAFGPNSSVIVADKPSDPLNSGKINISNNTIIEGSGDPESYLMMVSTNTGANAIILANNSSGTILSSPYGTTNINNNASIKEIISYKLNLSNNSILTYESGLVDTNFASGPGGAWRIKRGTWQIIK